jgi:hypothetical protein
MGLDMYLYKTKRVNGFKAKDYDEVESDVVNFSSVEELREKHPSLSTLFSDKSGVEKLDEALNNQGKFSRWASITEKVGEWRKANHIHYWFVKNCQGGVDECQMSIVNKSQLEKLLAICAEIINNKNDESLLKKLPTRSGFFFGSTSYDEGYFEDIEYTIQVLKDVLNNTDFDKEIILYQSSW